MDDKFYDLSEDVIATFTEIYNSKSFPINIAFKYIGASKQKQLIKVSKLSDEWSFITGKDMKVSINEEIFDKFDEESKRILMEQALDKYYVDANGNIKTTKPDFVTSSGMINKYGTEKLGRAFQVEDLLEQQTQDEQTEFIA